MKRIFIISILLSSFYYLDAALPTWVKTPPVSEYPDEYRYAVAVGKGRSENEARLDAEARMMEQVFKAHGCQNNSEIDFWQADGFRVRTEQGCTYVLRDKEGTYQFYMLYIYASKSNYYDQKNWKCRKIGKEKSDIVPYKTPTTKPLYWSDYENFEEYLSVQKFHKLEKGELFQHVVDSLSKQVQHDFLDKYSEYEATELFPSLMCQDYYYDKKNREIHVINFVKKSSLKNLYVNLISESLSVTIENELEDAKSYEVLEDWEMAKATYEKVQEQCNETSLRISQLKKIIGESPLSDYYTNEINTIRNKLRDGVTNLRKKATPDIEKKIMGLLDIAQKAEKERKLGTVLKYYYGALAYISRYPQLGEKSFYYDYTALGRPWGGNYSNISCEHVIKIWLPEHIKKILKEIEVYCYRDKMDVAKQNLVFLWPDKTPVTNGDFAFNINKGEGWSWLYTIDDGKGEIEKRDCPKQLDIQFEYKYMDQWHSDEAIRNEVKNTTIDFSKEATHHVIISSDIPSYANLATSKISILSDVKETNTNSKYEEQIKQVPVSEEKEYRDIIANVCNAINTQEYVAVQNHFTPNGYNLFLNLMKSGVVKVKDVTMYNLISGWDEIYARSIRMTIQYQNKRNVLTKNVVFVFNQDKKIKGIQFALDRITQNDINAQSEWDDGLKFAVLNFIENYQTAYNLKRLDYIESVFSDDAIIIVGTVVPEKAELSDKVGVNFKSGKSQKVKYYNLSKDEYLKRLKRIFATNEWININFANVDISQHPDTGAKSVYGLGLKQDYSSQNYGDTGYLFLVVDMNDQQKPIIHLRVWTPEAEFGWPQYLQLLEEEQGKKR